MGPVIIMHWLVVRNTSDTGPVKSKKESFHRTNAGHQVGYSLQVEVDISSRHWQA